MKALVVSGKIILTFGICVVLGIVFNLLLSIFIDPESMPHIMNGPKSLFVILGAVILMMLLFKKDRSLSLGLQEKRKSYLSVAGSIYGILLVVVSFAVVFIVGEVNIQFYSYQSAVLASAGVGTFLALCDSISEEILFRGYIQEMIKKCYGVWSGVLISAVPFATLHSLGHDVFSHPLILINLALAGVFLALLREMTGSIWLPIGFHFTWNSFNRYFGTEDSLVTVEFGPNEWISGGSLGFENGVANTLIMTTLIVVMSFRLQRNQSSKQAQYGATA